MAKTRYRLALDLGATSLGWCAYRLNEANEPIGILRMGVRIFSDGRLPSGHSKAAERRKHRLARRTRDRKLRRLAKFLGLLTLYGLMPTEPRAREKLKNQDPYLLRQKGLTEPLTPFELGRALYHLARRRGFRSNRKARSSEADKKETKPILAAIEETAQRIKAGDFSTLGAYLAAEKAAGRGTRARKVSVKAYTLYAKRDMIEHEFNKLWDVQQPHHPELLTEQAREMLLGVMLRQRRLREVMPGNCSVNPTEKRARMCSPWYQQYYLLQYLNHLRIWDDPLHRQPARAPTLAERNGMLALLRQQESVTPTQLAKAAGFTRQQSFVAADDQDTPKKIKGHLTHIRMSRAMGAAWDTLSEPVQHALAVVVAVGDPEEDVAAALQALPDVGQVRRLLGKHHDALEVVHTLDQAALTLTEAQARALAGVELPDGYGSLGLTALRPLIHEMTGAVISQREAMDRAILSQTGGRTIPQLKQLPYYGAVLLGHTQPVARMLPEAERQHRSPADLYAIQEEEQHGRVNNPTVHVGLNQVRQLVNALIRRYGPPTQAVVELARSFGASEAERKAIIDAQNKNEKLNTTHREELHKLGQKDNAANRERLRLRDEWGKNGAVCVYSGRPISTDQLFSEHVEVDHILPESRSAWNGLTNKVLCYRNFNREKRHQTPYECYGKDEKVWAGILDRIKALPKAKQRLFAAGSLDTFLGERGFLDRDLHVTGWACRLTALYLQAVCPLVWASNGRLTAALRHHWRLGIPDENGQVRPGKNRDDHRHHALDAALIGLSDPRMIQQVGRLLQRRQQQDLDVPLLEGLDMPWATWKDDVTSTLGKIWVSHKPDVAGVDGYLHKDSNYGSAQPRGERPVSPEPGLPIKVDAIKYESIADLSLTKIKEKLNDQGLQAQLLPLVEKAPAEEHKALLTAWAKQHGVWKAAVRTDNLGVLSIHDRKTGEPYRYVRPDNNHAFTLFETAPGSGCWDGRAITQFEAVQRGWLMSSNPQTGGLRLLHKGDILMLTTKGKTKPWLVQQFSSRVTLVPLHEANADRRARANQFVPLRKDPQPLMALKPRRAGVDILGYLNVGAPL